MSYLLETNKELYLIRCLLLIAFVLHGKIPMLDDNAVRTSSIDGKVFTKTPTLEKLTIHENSTSLSIFHLLLLPKRV